MRRLNTFLYRSIEPKFTTYLPVQLDGTCNGFQHLALLSNDVNIFEHLNLDNKGKDKNPSDFFSFFLEKMNIFITLKYNEETDTVKKERWQRLRNLGLSRKNLKPALMPLPYNVTVFTMINYLMNTLEIVKIEELDSPISSNTEPETESLNIVNNDGKQYKRWFGISKDSNKLVEYEDLHLYCKTLI
jgi:DNA-directed RNA polymerase